MLILGWLGDNLRNKSVQSSQRLNSAAGKNERKREGGLTDFDYFFTPPIGLFVGLFLRSTWRGYVCFWALRTHNHVLLLDVFGKFAISFIHFQHVRLDPCVWLCLFLDLEMTI